MGSNTKSSRHHTASIEAFAAGSGRRDCFKRGLLSGWLPQRSKWSRCRAAKTWKKRGRKTSDGDRQSPFEQSKPNRRRRKGSRNAHADVKRFEGREEECLWTSEVDGDAVGDQGLQAECLHCEGAARPGNLVLGMRWSGQCRGAWGGRCNSDLDGQHEGDVAVLAKPKGEGTETERQDSQQALLGRERASLNWVLPARTG